MADVRWAISGVGIAGFARSKAIRRDERSELACVYRGRKASETGAPVVDTLDEAIERADAVAICSPNEAHPAQVRRALQAHRHVVCEFPLAPEATIAADLFELARQRDRVLHVEHIELLGGVARMLRGHLRPVSVEQVTLGFQRQGPDDVPGGELALGNVARLHRLVDACGPIATVDEVDHAPGRLHAHLTLVHGAPVELLFEQSPYYSRTTQLEIRDHQATWRQENRALFRDEVPQTLLEATPLFAQDHAWAMRRIADGEPEGYVDPATILHVLRATERLRDARTGPVD